MADLTVLRALQREAIRLRNGNGSAHRLSSGLRRWIEELQNEYGSVSRGVAEASSGAVALRIELEQAIDRAERAGFDGRFDEAVRWGRTALEQLGKLRVLARLDERLRQIDQQVEALLEAPGLADLRTAPSLKIPQRLVLEAAHSLTEVKLRAAERLLELAHGELRVLETTDGSMLRERLVEELSLAEARRPGDIPTSNNRRSPEELTLRLRRLRERGEELLVRLG